MGVLEQQFGELWTKDDTAISAGSSPPVEGMERLLNLRPVVVEGIEGAEPPVPSQFKAEVYTDWGFEGGYVEMTPEDLRRPVGSNEYGVLMPMVVLWVKIRPDNRDDGTVIYHPTPLFIGYTSEGFMAGTLVGDRIVFFFPVQVEPIGGVGDGL